MTTHYGERAQDKRWAMSGSLIKGRAEGILHILGNYMKLQCSELPANEMSNNLPDGARFNCGLGSLGGHGGLPFGMDLDIAVQLEPHFWLWI